MFAVPAPVAGSSPLTRGKLFVRRFACGAARLIPAHAGKTLARASRIVRDEGSSPLTRGKHFLTCAFIA